jgi:anti-sigma regulatory factor (Ser/Thr protein kinase)
MASLHARLSLDAMLAADAVDLSRVQFVRPGGLVCLSSLIETWTIEDRPLEVRLPPDGITGYMQRMDFFANFGDKLLYDKDVTRFEIGIRHNDASLSELRTVRTEDEVSEVTLCFHRLLSEGNLARNEVNRCCKVLSEFLENAVIHAESPCGAFTAIQTYRMGGKRVCVAVADAGIGIPATLNDHPEATRRGVRTDGGLIELAAVDGVSRLGADRGGGFGSALRSVGSGKGKLTAWSREGWVMFSGTACARAERAHPFHGTCIEAEFPLS